MDREKVIEEMSLLRDSLMREQRKVFKGNNDSAVMALMHYRNIVIDAMSLLKEQDAEIKEKNQRIWELLCEMDGDDGK